MNIVKREHGHSLKEMPKNSPIYRVNVPLKKKSFEKLKKGVLPMNMENRWFILYENQKLFLYRSWTGVCIAILNIEDINDSYYIKKIQINGNYNEFKSLGKDKDIKLVFEEIEKEYDLNLIID